MKVRMQTAQIGQSENGGPLGRRFTIRAALVSLVGLALLAVAPAPAHSQGITDLDYEDLTLRGVMLDAGRIFPNGVEAANSYGGRIDLGFLGTGVRATVGLNRWSSFLDQEEVASLEDRLEELVFEQTGEATSIDLGDLSWSDTALNADAHVLWRVPFGVLTYAGVGATVHFLNGGGRSIEDTFIEDLLDSVRAGGNIHTGVEVPVVGRFRIVGEARYEFLESLRYFQIRAGGQFTFGPLASGEG